MIKIIGIGNRMYGDDGIGPCLVSALKHCTESIDTVQFIPLDLPNHGDIIHLGNSSLIVLVDSAVDEKTVLYKVDTDKVDLRELLELAQSSSGHGINPLSLIALAKIAGILSNRQSIYLLLIGPLTPQFGTGLSKSAIREAIISLKKLENLIKSHGQAFRYNEDCIREFLENICRDPVNPL